MTYYGEDEDIARQARQAAENHGEQPFWLERETFQVEHNPNCPSPYKVRLVQYQRGRIDGTEADAIGHGKTLKEAAEKARIQRDAVKALAIAKRAGVSVPTSGGG